MFEDERQRVTRKQYGNMGGEKYCWWGNPYSILNPRRSVKVTLRIGK